MALKLKLGRTLEVPVRFVLRDGARDVPHAFTLIIHRLLRREAADLFERIGMGAQRTDRSAEEAAEAVRTLLAELVIDWRGQRLVVDEDDQPAPYSTQAMELMLDVVGVGPVLTDACIRALLESGRDEAEDRRKN